MASKSFQVKGNDRKTIIRMKSELKLSHFSEVPKATHFLRQEGTVDENRRLPSTLAGLITKTPRCRRIAVSSRVEMTPGNEM